MTNRINRYVWLILAIAVVALVGFLLRAAIFPFIVGGALAYILYPLVKSVEGILPWKYSRPQLNRVISIFIVFAFALGVVAGALIAIIRPIIEQFQQFIDSLPDLFATARISVESWGNEYTARVPEEVRLQIEDALQNASSIIVGAVRNLMLRTVQAASSALTIVIGLAIVPLFLFYALKDRESFAEGIVSYAPSGSREHARSVVQIINHTFSSYVRAQLFLGLVVGFLVFLGLFLLNVRFSLILGIVAGLFELVPIIGPWLGAIPGLIVVLATSPEDFFWVVLVYLGVQVLENTFLVPRIQSQALHVHPVVIMLVLVVGSELAGIWGIVLGPPVVVAAMAVLNYFRAEWSEPETTSLDEFETEEPAPEEAESEVADAVTSSE